METGKLSQWRDTEGLSAEKGRELAARLELRARAGDEIAAREQYLDLLRLAPGERVLDVGCGSGVVTRAIARRVAPGGVAVGIDSSPALLAQARAHADAENFGGSIELRQGDCRRLPFADGAFDAVLAATVLAHVPDARRALEEMVRVTRPGRRVGVFDFDGDSFLIAHPDRELTRRIVAAHCDHSAVNGRLVRELPGIFAELGLVAVQARGFMPLERAAGSFYADLAARAGHTAAATGAITAEELARWQEALQATIAADRFVGGRLHLFVWGSRPAPR